MLALCCEHGIGISFLTEQGRFLARVQGPISGKSLCGVHGTAWQIAGKQHFLVGTILTAKIANSRVVLLRAAREIDDPERQRRLREAANRLSSIGLEALVRQRWMKLADRKESRAKSTSRCSTT